GAEYLSHIDETSRRILDSLRLLREDPAAAAAAGVRLQDGPAALMAEVAAVEQERQRRRLSLETAAPAGTAAPAAPGPAGRPGDGLYEAVGGSAARPGPAAAAGPPWAQSSLVHRRPETLPDEETQRGGRAAAAEIERNLAKQEQTAQAAEIRAETSQTAQNLTAGTAEDITELINTTLRRQIGMITEQVYGQLERKLQNEKARRGRM
ncbi:MAG: hypothetical protein LBK56_10315, partial [Gracilibacteraceae bacterium]|nr:hypothetical protein [Gracilibacteraceae bacterium]